MASSLLEGLQVLHPTQPQQAEETTTTVDKPEGTETKQDVPPVAEKAVPATRTEVKVSEAKPEIKEVTKPTRTDFQKLEDAKKAAEKERDEVRQRAEASEKRIAELDAQLKEIEPVKKNATEIQTLLKQREEELASLRQELKSASIERDPEFQEKYVQGKQQQIDHLKDLALTKGVDENVFLRAIRTGDEDQLQEIRENLAPHQQRRWDAHFLKLEQLEVDRQDEVAHADRTWQKRQEAQKQQFSQTAEQQINTHRKLGKEVIAEMLPGLAHLKDDQELMTDLERTVEGVAGGEGTENWNTKALIHHVLAAKVLNKVVQDQYGLVQAGNAKVEELEKSMKEKDEKIANYETFIKSRHGSLPGAETFSGDKKSTGDYDPSKSLLSQIVVKRG